jgi:hypothetical protein
MVVASSAGDNAMSSMSASRGASSVASWLASRAGGTKWPVRAVEARGELLVGASEVNEADLVGVGDELGAVGCYKRGAGDDIWDAGGELRFNVCAHGGEPRCAVGIGEGGAGGEFGDVGGRVKVVGVGEMPAQRIGQCATYGGFTGTGDAHYHKNAGRH